MESHDEERLIVAIQTDGNITNPWYNISHPDTVITRMISAAAFFCTIPGPKMIWQFSELGLQKTINLRSEEMSVTVVGNFGVQPTQILPGFNQLGKWYDYFTGDSLNVVSLTDNIYMKAGEFKLFTSKRLAVPETGLSIPEKARYHNTILGEAYPNPASGNIIIPINMPARGQLTLELYNSTGVKVLELFNGHRDAGLQLINAQLDNLPAGLYYLRLRSGKIVENERIVIF